jgi:outer membrane protein TolC
MRPLRTSLGVALACSALLGGAPVAGAQEARSLSRDAALRLAAERNAALMVTGLERARFGAVADVARAQYTPKVFVETAARDNGSGATVAKAQQTAVEALGTASYQSPYGQTVTVNASITSGLSSNQDSGRSLTIEVSQALLRGGFHGGATDLRQADLDARIAREAYRSQLNQLLKQTDRAYWDLVFAHEDVEIKRRSRDRARSQFEETRENIRRGLLAPGEIYVVEENVVNFDDLLSRAEENLAAAQSVLRRFLNLPPGAPVEASSGADTGAVAGAPEADSLGVAAVKNPDVLAARLRVDRADVGIDGRLRDALPQLDVFGRFGVATGRTDDLLVYVPGDRQLRAGVRVSLPFYWGPDAARVRGARIELAQRRGDLADAENAAATAVHDAAVRIRAREQRLDLAARLVDLGQKKLDNERDKYKSGLSTLADVVRFQRDLDAALSSAIRARVDVLEARTEMLAARGDLHESLQVQVR